MSKELTQREMASMGAKALRQKYSKRQLKNWAAMGGRPVKLSEKDRTRLLEMLKAGKSLEGFDLAQLQADLKALNG
jgi:transposase